jgi:hypothetical protein
VDKIVDKARVVPKSLRFVTALLKKEPSDCSKIAWLTNQGTPMGIWNFGMPLNFFSGFFGIKLQEMSRFIACRDA